MSEEDKELTFEVGKYYKTRGGWKALIVWIDGCVDNTPPTHVISFGKQWIYCVHKPNTTEERGPVSHVYSTGKAVTQFSVNEPPQYECDHPADLVEEWEEVE